MTDTMHDTRTEEPEVLYEDYWGAAATVRHHLPDGKQWFEIQPMNEGARARYQKLTSRDVVMSQKKDEAKISMDPATDRQTLIKESVIDWHLMQKDSDGKFYPAPFAKRNLEQWLEKAPAHIVDKLEHAIRMANPWLQAEMTLDDLYEERDRLDDLIKQKKAEEAGEDVSANR